MMAGPSLFFMSILFIFVTLKGACSDPQPHIIPPLNFFFFKHIEILVPEFESYYLEGFVCELKFYE